MKSKTFSRGACSALTAVLLLGGPAIVLCADDKKPTDSSLDQELIDSLDSELLEGLETIPPDEAHEQTKDGDEPSHDASDEEDAFTRVSNRMREAERLIPKIDATKSTKKLQKEIVTDLEKLISQLEQQCKKCQGGSCSKPSDQQTAEREPQNQPSQKSSAGQQDAKKPAKDASERLGKDEARKATLERMKSLLREDRWGELPAKAREQLLQLSPEQFLPKYELLIEEYYKRLAEKQGTSK
jgi:hypothetical protein